MIVIPRKKGESIVIGDDIVLTVVEIRGDRLRLQVECPSRTAVHRKESLDAIVKQGGAGDPEPGPSFWLDDVTL